MNIRIDEAYKAILMILPLVERGVDIDEELVEQELYKGTLDKALEEFLKEKSDIVNSKYLNLSFMNEMNFSKEEAYDFGFNKPGLCYIVYKLLPIIYETSIEEDV